MVVGDIFILYISTLLIYMCTCVCTHQTRTKTFLNKFRYLSHPHCIKIRKKTVGKAYYSPVQTLIGFLGPVRWKTNPVLYSKPSTVWPQSPFSATFNVILHLSLIPEHYLHLLTCMLFSYFSLYSYWSLSTLQNLIHSFSCRECGNSMQNKFQEVIEIVNIPFLQCILSFVVGKTPI